MRCFASCPLSFLLYIPGLDTSCRSAADRFSKIEYFSPDEQHCLLRGRCAYPIREHYLQLAESSRSENTGTRCTNVRSPKSIRLRIHGTGKFPATLLGKITLLCSNVSCCIRKLASLENSSSKSSSLEIPATAAILKNGQRDCCLRFTDSNPFPSLEQFL